MLEVPTLTLAEIALGPVHISHGKSGGMQYSMAALFTQTTDEILERIFGQKARAEIYNYLEKTYNLNKNEIPAKPDIFSKGMSSLFGSISNLIELNIAKVVCNRLDLDIDLKANFSFTDYVAIVKNLRNRRVP